MKNSVSLSKGILSICRKDQRDRRPDDHQFLRLGSHLVDVFGVITRVGIFSRDQQIGRGEIISMLAYIGKLKNDIGVVAVHAVWS